MKTGFDKLRALAVDQIEAAAPPTTKHAGHPAIAAIAEIMALDAVKVTFEIPEDHVGATIVTSPKVPDGTFAASMLRAIAQEARIAIDGTGGLSYRRNQPSLADQVNSTGLVGLAERMLKAGADLGDVHALHDVAARAVGKVSGKLSRMKTDIVSTIMARDLPTLKSCHVSEMVRWMLCLEHEGKATRKEAISRRLQAHLAYGAVQSVLRTKEITAVIDAGEQLAPALRRRLGIDAARLRAVNGLLTIAQSQNYDGDRTGVVFDLAAFDMPAHEWEDRLRSPDWINRRNAHILSPDYVADDTAVRDTLSAFATDILAPIAATRIAGLGLDADQLGKVSGVASGGDPGGNADPIARRRYLGAMRSAIAGRRQGRAFREAAMIWHRRAACAAALRHENRSGEDNGWPAFCRPWTSSDGGVTVTPIVTAAGLVEEGTRMSHCVGGYYDQCRSGGTHILSMRGPDGLAATLEILVSIRDGSFVMSRGQFKTYHDRKPGEEMQEAMREFIADVTGGRHRIAKKEIAEHIRKERENGDYRSGGLDMEHARASWGLYRVMMPRPTPETLDEWIAENGVHEAIDDVVRSILGLAEPKAMAMAA